MGTEDAALCQLEETIRRYAHVYRALLRQCHEGILLVTPEMTVLRLVHPLMGYAEADVIGVPLLSFVHPEDAAVVSEAFARVLAIHCNYRNITQHKRHEEMAQCMAAYLACPEYAMSTLLRRGNCRSKHLTLDPPEGITVPAAFVPPPKPQV